MKIFKIFMCMLGLTLIYASVGFSNSFKNGLDAAKTGDFNTAIEIFLPLAETNNALAQEMLGLIYEQGLGVQKDYAKAFKWTQLAAQQGLPDAQNRLGGLHLRGLGVPENRSKAMKWYELASKQGHLAALTNQGVIYLLSENLEKAAEIYKISASRGDTRAQFSLGVMYEKGIGLEQSNILAFMWYDLSSFQGYEAAFSSRDILIKVMNKEDISISRNMARKCLSSSYKKCD
jgi:TPR repeat protein